MRAGTRFHHPDDRTPGILRLRDLHAAMDRAVLDAYGWTDLIPAYDFRPQLDESTRYTWAEDTRDEVLGHSVTMLAPPEGQDELSRILDRIGRGHVQHFEATRLRKDGQRVVLSGLAKGERVIVDGDQSDEARGQFHYMRKNRGRR